jgi:hypothetical protein
MIVTSNPDMLGGTVPLVLGGSMAAAATCFVVLATVAPPEGPLLSDPPRCLLAGLGLVALAVPLHLAGRLVRTRQVPGFRFQRSVATTSFCVGLACLTLGSVWIARGAYPLLRLLAGS